MRTLGGTVAAVAILAAGAMAGEVRDGTLLVDGKPFFPLGSWNSTYTTPADIARLGMNTSFRGGPGTPEAVEAFRALMRACAAKGIQMVPYLSYGGAGVTPWRPESVRAIAKLASEPNLLCWYVGDDITMRHLDGIRQTVGILRDETPAIPTVADYIADETPEAKTVFTQYVDIRCQYWYPIPDDPFTTYLEFFDRQRAFVGDPLWTWVQCFQWGRTGSQLHIGAEGPGPVPDPEQVRLLSFAAINRGVRGLLFFPHHELHRLPELAAEVALTCHESTLVSAHLAGGSLDFDLTTSDPDLKATAFTYGGSTVVAASLFRPEYHRWIDEGHLENASIECPWQGQQLPKALLLATPDAVDCAVTQGDRPGTVRLALPSLELAGFILLSNDARELEALKSGAAAIPGRMRTLLVPAAAAQARKVCDVVWRTGQDNLYAPSVVMEAMRATEECAEALDAGDPATAFAAWRTCFRACRTLLDNVMQFANDRRELIPAQQQRFLLSPHGLHNIPGLGETPPPEGPWRFLQQWMVTGPFPLDWDGEKTDAVPPGFDRAYAPEASTELGGVFDTVDGRAIWRYAEAGPSGLLDFLPYFVTVDNVVCYARCRITAPRGMTVRFSLGSNDGARAWVNGEDVFRWCSVPQGGRTASPHQNEFTAELRAGANTLLVKVENLGSNWQLYAAVDDPDRVLVLEAW